MTKKLKLSELAEFDPSKYLDDDEAMADYIRLAIEDGDPGLLAAALGDVARARGMTQVAQSAGLTREALYKALRPEAHPRFDTIQKVCKALGVKLTATVDADRKLTSFAG
jgi:probable addiction module antidote protein